MKNLKKKIWDSSGYNILHFVRHECNIPYSIYYKVSTKIEDPIFEISVDNIYFPVKDDLDLKT